jgi:hypothetical protein
MEDFTANTDEATLRTKSNAPMTSSMDMMQQTHRGCSQKWTSLNKISAISGSNPSLAYIVHLTFSRQHSCEACLASQSSSEHKSHVRMGFPHAPSSSSGSSRSLASSRERHTSYEANDQSWHAMEGEFLC